MPLQCFWTAMLANLILQILLDGVLNGPGRRAWVSWFAARKHLRRPRARLRKALGGVAYRGRSTPHFLVCPTSTRSCFLWLQDPDHRRRASNRAREISDL